MWDDWQMRDEQRRTADYNGDSIESSLAGFSGLRVRDVMSNRQQLCVAYKQPGEQAAAIVAVPTRTTAPEVEAGMRRPQTNATLNPWLLGQMRMDPQMFRQMELTLEQQC
jgi:hypothetical protein